MRVNNGLTPQELEAYGISDVHDIVYNPSYDLLYQEELDPSLTGYERGVLTNLMSQMRQSRHHRFWLRYNRRGWVFQS